MATEISIGVGQQFSRYRLMGMDILARKAFDQYLQKKSIGIIQNLLLKRMC